MATYYVRKTGSDSNAGTSAATAWLTLGKALGAAGIASGDTVYVGAGVYREAVTVAMTSATAETKIIADVTGEHTGDAGEVRWTSFTTNDKTATSASASLSLAARDFLTFEHFVIVGGSPTAGCLNGAVGSTNIRFYRCAFISGAYGARAAEVTLAADANAAWVFDSCLLVCWNEYPLSFILTTSATADYDAGVSVYNCKLITVSGGAGVRVGSTGAGAFKGGGVLVDNCTLFGGSRGVQVTDANVSTTIPVRVRNCLILGQSSAGFVATTLGQIVENYNVLSVQARTNVTAGANSTSGTNFNYAPLVEFGQSALHGRSERDFLTPAADSPYLGFGSDGAVTLTTDMLGVPRPSGPGPTNALKAVGARERGDVGQRETTTVRTGSNALKISGPGCQDFEIPVDAASTTISVHGRFDSTYAGTKPKLQVLAQAELGVSAAEDVMTGSADTWEELTLSFTPTAKGVVTVRLLSGDTNGAGKAFFDDPVVS